MGNKKSILKIPQRKEKHSFGIDKEKLVFRSNMGRLGDKDEDLKTQILERL